jgi:hypothetical protein
VKAIEIQSGADGLLDVLVREPVPAREHFYGIADEEVQKHHKRIKFHHPHPSAESRLAQRRHWEKVSQAV